MISPSKKFLFHTSSVIAIAVSFTFLLTNSSCGVYSFRSGRIPDSIKTIKVNYIDNRAQYINPQLSQQITDKLRQKIVNQTRLTQTNNTNEAHYEISGTITNYAVSTSGVANQQTATNRLTVGVKVTLVNHLSPLSQGKNPKEINVSRSFDFDASLSLPEAERGLTDQIVTNVVDEIFNNIFSDW